MPHQENHGSGKLIVLEGNEAVGKTTVKTEIVKFIESQSFEVIETRSPGGCVQAEAIRSVIMDHDLHPQTEVALFVSAILENYHKVILPALLRGKWVVCDRLFSSTIAYQIYGRQLDGPEFDMIRSMLGQIVPDLEIFIVMEESLRLDRLAIRGKENRMDEQSLDFYSRVNAGYYNCALAQSWSINKASITNNSSREDFKKDAIEVIRSFMKQNALTKD